MVAIFVRNRETWKFEFVDSTEIMKDLSDPHFDRRICLDMNSQEDQEVSLRLVQLQEKGQGKVIAEGLKGEVLGAISFWMGDLAFNPREDREYPLLGVAGLLKPNAGALIINGRQLLSPDDKEPVMIQIAVSCNRLILMDDDGTDSDPIVALFEEDLQTGSFTRFHSQTEYIE